MLHFRSTVRLYNSRGLSRFKSLSKIVLEVSDFKLWICEVRIHSTAVHILFTEIQYRTGKTVNLVFSAYCNLSLNEGVFVVYIGTIPAFNAISITVRELSIVKLVWFATHLCKGVSAGNFAKETNSKNSVSIFSIKSKH